MHKTCGWMKVDEKEVFIQIVVLKIMDLEGAALKVLPD